jgi:hypothetical protein
MSAKAWAPMAYRLLFWRTVHPLLRVHFLFFLTDLYRPVFFPTGGNFPTWHRNSRKAGATTCSFRVGWIYYLQFRSVLNCWFIELCTMTWRIWYLWINMALWRTDRRWRTCWSALLLCWIQLKKDFRRILKEYAINCYWRRCLWVLNLLDACV